MKINYQMTITTNEEQSCLHLDCITIITKDDVYALEANGQQTICVSHKDGQQVIQGTCVTDNNLITNLIIPGECAYHTIADSELHAILSKANENEMEVIVKCNGGKVIVYQKCEISFQLDGYKPFIFKRTDNGPFLFEGTKF